MTSLVMVFLIVGANPFTVWHEEYDGENTDKGHGVCIDSNNNVVITGESNPGADFDMWFVVTSKDGDSLHSWLYDIGGDEKGYAVVTTHDGSLAAAGPVDNGMRTILFDSQGDFIWDWHGNSGEVMEVRAITVSPDSIIYSLGYHLGGTFDYIVVNGYNYEGEQIAAIDDDTDLGGATGIVAVTEGYAYVSVNEFGRCALSKYAYSGNREWRNVYDDLSTKAFSLCMDEAFFLFQSGDVATTGSNADFLLLKWDTTGALIWPQHKAYDMGHNEYCRDIKLDAISDCYLAGWQERGLEKDAALVKTDSAGSMLWSWVDTLEGDQEIEALEVDSDGYIYLAGSSHNGENWDMLVMQVRQPLTIEGEIRLTGGADRSFVQGDKFIITGDTSLEVPIDSLNYCIELYNGGHYVITPEISGYRMEPDFREYHPLRHRMIDQDFEGYWIDAVAETPDGIPFNLEVTNTTVLFTLPYSTSIRLALYDPSGREVAVLAEGHHAQGTHRLALPVLDAGIYFARLETGDDILSRKLVIFE